jgi:hypothetical protein
VSANRKRDPWSDTEGSSGTRGARRESSTSRRREPTHSRGRGSPTTTGPDSGATDASPAISAASPRSETPCHCTALSVELASLITQVLSQFGRRFLDIENEMTSILSRMKRMELSAEHGMASIVGRERAAPRPPVYLKPLVDKTKPMCQNLSSPSPTHHHDQR